MLSSCGAAHVDAIVVGAGVVGLAVARALATKGRETIVLERESRIGTQTSSRNSEVIHAGIYYPPGSLKARLCVEGRRELYGFLETRGIDHRRCGKLIVATSSAQAAALGRIRAQAAANGVDDLRLLSGPEARALEPALTTTVAALLSPSTGILDSHGYMLALQGEAEAAGATVALNTAFCGAAVLPGGRGFDVCVVPAPETAVAAARGGNDSETKPVDPVVISAKLLVNCAGLSAQAVARSIDGMPALYAPPVLHLCKGSYFSLAGKAPFSRLIYPLPEAAGLGVHLTLDLGGQARFGPDVEWLHEPTIPSTVGTNAASVATGSSGLPEGLYAVDPRRGAAFFAAIRSYWPALSDGALTPAFAGLRPKVSPPGAPAADFVIDGPGAHGIPGLVQLFGVESPGLTASLAIGEHVCRLLER